MNKPTLKPPAWISKKICSKLPDSWVDWVEGQAKGQERAWLLAFALEGAAWGVIENGTLKMADNIFRGKVLSLADSTLQELYVFSPKSQAHAWVQGSVWQASLLTESGAPGGDSFDQDLILWGSYCPDENWQSGFALLVEGVQGMIQAVPLTRKPAMTSDRKNAPRLKVRNYIGQDPHNGAAYVAATRFVELLG